LNINYGRNEYSDGKYKYKLKLEDDIQNDQLFKKGLKYEHDFKKEFEKKNAADKKDNNKN